MHRLPLAPGKRSSHRCRSRFHTQSRNRRLRSGNCGSPPMEYPRRSQSASPGHFPVHGSRRGSLRSNPTHPSACPPQCGQRSTSHPSLCLSRERRRNPGSCRVSSCPPSLLCLHRHYIVMQTNDNPLDERRRHGNRCDRSAGVC